jgi:hypothetical protein
MEDFELKDNDVSEPTSKILRCPQCKQTTFSIFRSTVRDKEGKNPHITECAECVVCDGWTIVTHLKVGPHEVDSERIGNITFECEICRKQYSPDRTFKVIHYQDGDEEIIPEIEWKCSDHPEHDPFIHFDEDMK